MFKIMTADKAIELIKDYDCMCMNSFVGISNPEALHNAIYKRYKETGSPKHLTIVSSAGFGLWDENRNAEGYIRDGAVDKLICGHFGAMPSTKKLVLEDRFEAYNLPLGGISHAIRAQAGGLPGAISKVGIGLFVDPRLEGPGINGISNDKTIATVVELDGEEYMYYKLPPINVALIKATECDASGDISFANEFIVGDALSICQAVKRNGGTVIVQVDKLTNHEIRPRNAIIPSCLVDAVVIEPPHEVLDIYDKLTGEDQVPLDHMDYWLSELNKYTAPGQKDQTLGDIIGRRAAKELKKDDIVNIGVGLPENVSKFANEVGLLKDLTLTVESGAVGGLPASGKIFGSVIGAGSIYDMAMQFDYYNGGGLDICFMGGLEVDKYGNVNAHRAPGAFSGVGGFSNITSNTPTVVFCLTFNTKGLKVKDDAGTITVLEEGQVAKFVPEVRSISFSGKNAVKNGQRVLYVTERCVFELTEKGLKLVEVYPGIDAKTQVLDLLPFEVEYDG